MPTRPTTRCRGHIKPLYSARTPEFQRGLRRGSRRRGGGRRTATTHVRGRALRATRANCGTAETQRNGRGTEVGDGRGGRRQRWATMVGRLLSFHQCLLLPFSAAPPFLCASAVKQLGLV